MVLGVRLGMGGLIAMTVRLGEVSRRWSLGSRHDSNSTLEEEGEFEGARRCTFVSDTEVRNVILQVSLFFAVY